MPFREKQESLEKIREKLYAQMQQRKDDEDIRIDNAKTETEEKIAEEERQKMEKNHKWQKDMAAHRNQQVRVAKNVFEIEIETLIAKVVIEEWAPAGDGCKSWRYPSRSSPGKSYYMIVLFFSVWGRGL